MVIVDNKRTLLRLIKKIFLPPLLGLLAGEFALVFYLMILNVIDPLIESGLQALLLAALFASIVVLPIFPVFFMVHYLAVVLERILNREWGFAWLGWGVIVGINSGLIHFLDLTGSFPAGRHWLVLVAHYVVGGWLGLVTGAAQWWLYSRE
jgi:hypothetical protein